MNKMKIGTKLLLTYFLLIISIFLLTSVSFHFISQRYIIHETEQQLTKEARVISQLLGKSSLSSTTLKEKLRNRKALAISERLLSSKLIILNRNQRIVYTDLKDSTLTEYQQSQGREFVSKTIRIFGNNGKTKGYVTLVAQMEELQEINKLMRRSQLISLIISGLIAVILGLFFKREITRPIQRLSDHMKHFSLKESRDKIHLKSNDELGELADSFNALAGRLKQYDEDQKVFFQNASHELKTPLMAIQGNAEGIVDGVVRGEDVERSLNVIIAESQRLKRIVEGITYLAQLEGAEESFRFERVSFEEIIGEAVRSVKALAEQRGIEIRVRNDVSTMVSVDREKFIRAIINLIGNAIRYAETIIVVDAQMGMSSGVIIKIKDDGPGLKKGEEAKVFQRFYSGDEGGSGIGLTITKAIIEGHGGALYGYNGKQGGAVFEIRIPL